MLLILQLFGGTMATAQSVKAPKKAPKKTRDPLFSDEKYTGGEPVWDTERAARMSQEEFDHFYAKRSFTTIIFILKRILKNML